ncbi:hypothetical protein V6N12_054784 [Hibiscus sabdariffa]|uniref:Rhamnogalacturonase A/B/Epimerase-like pectate lyase domain-containing protein n=1 Tax=Hibiscus sabdariffa TaxID=183260 RepID=A0ABR2D2B3_9ROSI
MALQVVFAFLFISFALAQSAKTFDVRSYGAVSDGRTDNQKAFLQAWNDACNQYGGSVVFVPSGVYMLGPAVFTVSQA